MTDADRERFAQLMQLERDRMIANPPVPPEPAAPRTIHFSELPAPGPNSRGAAEWNFYRREVGRLLAEGNERRWVLIAGEAIVGIWDTEEEADRVRVDRFLTRDVLMKQIRTRERVVRGGGYFRPWR